MPVSRTCMQTRHIVIFSKTNEILSMKYLWPSTITIQNICLYSIFCDSLTNFHKVFFQKLLLVIIIFKHYTLRKQCDFVLLRYVYTMINSQNRDVFNNFLRIFATGKGLNGNLRFTAKMKIYRKYP